MSLLLNDNTVVPVKVHAVEHEPISEVPVPMLWANGYSGVMEASDAMGLSYPYDSILSSLVSILEVSNLEP